MCLHNNKPAIDPNCIRTLQHQQKTKTLLKTMREMKEKRIRHRAKHKESEEASKDAHTDGEMRGNPYRMQMFSFQEIKSQLYDW